MPFPPPTVVPSRSGGPAAARWARRGALPARYLTTSACAAAAGIHAALVPPHLAEAPPLGAAFAAAAITLAAAALLVRLPAYDGWAPADAMAVLSAVAACYLLSRTVGIPLLDPAPEQPDPLGIAATAIELLGAAGAAALISRKPAQLHRQGKDSA